MPRPRNRSRNEIIESAMLHFWRKGFGASSMDDLVRATGVSRHGLYAEFENKERLFAACLEAYNSQIVTPAFVRVEKEGATLLSVADYFEFQIARSETSRTPGLGCLMANTMTELASSQSQVFSAVLKHNQRLEYGFRNALCNSFPALAQQSAKNNLQNLALTMVIFTNGFWSTSRTIPDAARLRAMILQFINLIERSYHHVGNA